MQEKLDQIGGLSGQELMGWYKAVILERLRPQMPGELEALRSRALDLGLDLRASREVSS